MMRRETVAEARELVEKCRRGALVPNVEALRLLCVHQDDAFFQEIDLTRAELDMFVHARWLQKGRAAVVRCRARQRARRFDPVAFDAITEARQHGISLQELGLTPAALADLGKVPV